MADTRAGAGKVNTDSKHLVIHTHTQRTHTRKCSNNEGVVYEISKPTYMVSH